jgi:O-antigen polymerase
MNQADLRTAQKKEKGRARLILGVIVYILAFNWMYIHWLLPTFGYYGFDYTPPGFFEEILAWALAILPSCWTPLALIRPSQLPYWILYLVVYIPSLYVPMFVALSEPTHIIELMLTFFISFFIISLTYRFQLANWTFTETSSARFWYVFSTLGMALGFVVFFAFRHQLSVVSFLDVYNLRSDADAIMTGTGLNYPLMLLSGAVDPFLMGYGLCQQRKSVFLLGALGQLLVYASLGTKGSIASVIFIPALYFVLRRGPRQFVVKLTWGVVALLVALCLLTYVAGADPGTIESVILFIVFMRTFGSPGLLTAQYYYFFSQNPQTHYSHITGVNWFLHYPYSNPLGVVVGSYFSGDPTLDATAHFWAMDGLAAYGLTGVILVSVLCAFVFWMLDSAAKRHDSRFPALVVSYVAYNIANISLFTTLLSGGLGLLILLLYFAPPTNSQTDDKVTYAVVSTA